MESVWLRATAPRTLALLFGMSLLIVLPFVDQAFHVDDPNFLALARHASPNPLNLYDFEINWGGTDQRAFDILANPPLVPWYLAVLSRVADGREWVFHLGFVPFVFLALLGGYRLGCRFLPERRAIWTAVWIGASPAFVIASHTIMPDLPLLAFYSLGLALAIDGIDDRRTSWTVIGASLAGCAALCRYSGTTTVPLLLLYVLLRRPGLRLSLIALGCVLAPIAVWTGVSAAWYGQVHYLVIAGFEGQTLGVSSLLHKLGYQVVTLGLAITLAPLLEVVLGRRWSGSFLVGGGIGALVGMVVGLSDPMPVSSVGLLVLGMGGGGAGLATALSALPALGNRRVWRGRGGAEADSLFLCAWLVGTLVFNLWLLFASVRYLLPALIPAILLVQRVGLEVTDRWVARLSSTAALVALSLTLSIADYRFAEGYRSYVATLPPARLERWFVGHWGLQYYLESAGARALSSTATSTVKPGDEVIVPRYAWPQDVPTDVHLEPMYGTKVPGSWGLRTFTVEGRACFYADILAPGPTPVWLPFGFGRGPLEDIRRLRAVR